MDKFPHRTRLEAGIVVTLDLKGVGGLNSLKIYILYFAQVIFTNCWMNISKGKCKI